MAKKLPMAERKKKAGRFDIQLFSSALKQRVYGEAYDEKGRLAAEMSAQLDSDGVLGITGAYSHEERGSRVGTRLYETFAEFACDEGMTLASDTTRSTDSEGFWNKQYRKGRATHECWSDDKWSECRPDDDEKSRIRKAEWGTTRYRLKACPAPANLEGMKRRRRARRRR